MLLKGLPPPALRTSDSRKGNEEQRRIAIQQIRPPTPSRSSTKYTGKESMAIIDRNPRCCVTWTGGGGCFGGGGQGSA